MVLVHLFQHCSALVPYGFHVLVLFSHSLSGSAIATAVKSSLLGIRPEAARYLMRMAVRDREQTVSFDIE